jgi:hypothetical protein
MLTLNDRSLFIDSTDSDATEAAERLNIELTSPITSELEMNRLYMGLRNFTFTNLVYNIQQQDDLVFVQLYRYKAKRGFYERTVVNLEEGQYTGIQLEDQWALQQTTPGDPLNTTVVQTKNYTVIDPQNMEILPNLDFNPRTLKMSFSWASTGNVTSFKIPTSELEDDENYPYAPIPAYFILPINSVTKFMAFRLGLYKDTDILTESEYTTNQGILIPLSWTVATVDGGVNTLFTLNTSTYNFLHVFQEQALQFIDVSCDQIQTFHYASKANNLYPEGILARVPILAGFNQTQSIYYEELTWCPLSQSDISSLQFTLTNPNTSAALFKSPLQFEMVVHEEKVSIDELTETTADQQRFMLPLTNSGDRTTDNLDVAHSRQTPLQGSINATSYKQLQPLSNKRSRYPSGF